MSTQGHLKTWTKWLETLSALGNQGSDTIAAMAEALSYAVPSGPRGVECCDDCRCLGSSARYAAILYADLVEQVARPLSTSERDLENLRNAIQRDQISRSTSNQFPSRALAQVGVIVSANSSRVAIARSEWPATWAIVEEWLKNA